MMNKLPQILTLAAALAMASPFVAAAAAAAQAQGGHRQVQAPQNAGAQPWASGTITVMSAADLINRPLKDEQGHNAGQINAVVLDTGNGAVQFVLIGGRGDFSLNGQIIAVPWSVLVPPMRAQGTITTKVSAEKLAQAPRLDRQALYRLNEPNTRAGVYGYYGVPYGYGAGYYGRAGGYAPGLYGPGVKGGNGAVAAGYGSSTAGPAGEQNQGQNQTQKQAQHQQRLAPKQQQMVQNGLVVGPAGAVSELQSSTTRSAQALQSADVFSPTGETIGRVDQVMIDVDHGEVAFVLVERGGFLGLNASWYALPIEALAWAPYQGGGYRLTVDPKLLNGEPSVPVNRNQLPTHVSAQQLAQLYQHFGIRPYWQS